MKAFRLVRPRSVAEAVDSLKSNDGALLKASGIDLLDRMKERVDEPDVVIALLDTRGMSGVELMDGGGCRIGAGATLSDLAGDPHIREFHPTLAEAARLAASPQIRHRATIAGNLAQHTRCGYYRHKSFPCLKRGGDHCPVLKPGGVQDTAAVFGNAVCASAHPSSLAPVLGALDAVLRLAGPEGERYVSFSESWAAPTAGVAADLALRPGELITSIELPERTTPQRDGYEEVRQKAAFDWPLVSCAVRLGMDGDLVKEARVWLGSVAPTPWRATGAEAVLVGKRVTDARVHEAGEAAVVGASPLDGNRYKLQLVKVCVRRALAKAGKE